MEQNPKGVICKIIDDNDAPVDSAGNIADIIMDPNSTIDRMNLGRFYEQYINGASRDVHKRICHNMGITPFTDYTNALDWLQTLDKGIVETNYQYLVGYYSTVSNKMADWFASGKVKQSPVELLAEVVEKGIYLYMPTDNQYDTQEVILNLEKNYPQTFGPVTYTGNSGRRITTKESILIAPVYVILLEKIADTWSAVSSGKLQHFGVLSQLTKNDKYAKPSRQKAVRGAGEAEVRILVSYIGSEHVVELMDRNNNPSTHKLIVENILGANKPSNVDNLVDRRVKPFGGNKPLGLVNHILAVSGVKYAYNSHKTGGKK